MKSIRAGIDVYVCAVLDATQNAQLQMNMRLFNFLWCVYLFVWLRELRIHNITSKNNTQTSRLKKVEFIIKFDHFI